MPPKHIFVDGNKLTKINYLSSCLGLASSTQSQIVKEIQKLPNVYTTKQHRCHYVCEEGTQAFISAANKIKRRAPHIRPNARGRSVARAPEQKELSIVQPTKAQIVQDKPSLEAMIMGVIDTHQGWEPGTSMKTIQQFNVIAKMKEKLSNALVA